MKSQTSKLRQELLQLEDSEDRLKVLKNQYEGETEYNRRWTIIEQIYKRRT